MLNKLPTLYFNYPTPLNKPEKKESKKISYWLEKLHILAKQEPTSLVKNPSVQFKKSETTFEEESIYEQTEKQNNKVETDRQLVDDLVKTSNRCIFNISSANLFNFFPDSINIEF